MRILVGFAIGAVVTRVCIAACGPQGAAGPTTVPLASLGVQTPIFAFERNGRFLKGNIAKGEWRTISDHGFDYVPTVVPSPDGRWISYSGELKTGTSKEYWIFDKQTGADRRYHVHPAWGGAIPAFSPDGKAIAMYSNYDRRWPKAEGTGLYIFESESLKATFLEVPGAAAAPRNEPFGKAYWSRDGLEVLLALLAGPQGGEPIREHYSYRVAQQRFDRIAGEYERREQKFLRGKLPIAVSNQSRPQSDLLFPTLLSPDKSWDAWVGAGYELRVRDKNGVAKKVGAGRYDDCRGVTIGINGWLDSRHLVYSIAGKMQVFDAETGRDAVLFESQPAVVVW